MRYAERGGRVEAYSLGTALILLEMFSISNSYSGRYHFPDRFPLGLTGNEEITKNVTRLTVPLSEFVIVKPGIAPRCGKGERWSRFFAIKSHEIKVPRLAETRPRISSRCSSLFKIGFKSFVIFELA